MSVNVNQQSERRLEDYDLDKLALALSPQDGINGHNITAALESSSPSAHELPLLLAPLSHQHPLLSSSVPFDVDAFLLSRPNTSLPDLRSELRGYLAQLKEELVQLINDDYAAFISLSTDLKGEGTRLERLHWPLDGIKGEITASRSELANVQDTVKERLAERAALREEKALLHLLLKLSDSIVRLETLLLIPAPPDSNVGTTTAGHSSLSSIDINAVGMRDLNGMHLGLQLTLPDGDPKDDRSRVNQAKHLSRVATEYTQLLYHAEKARNEKCAFVEEMQGRIDKIRMTLTKDLDLLFSNILTSFGPSSSESGVATTDRARLVVELSECLKTYDILGGWRDAEEVVRRDLVHPFIKKNIFTGVLNTAPSPLMPRTPMHVSPRSALLSPRTPHTPFLTMRNHLLDSPAIDDSTILLDESEDSSELSALFNKILRFVQLKCKDIMDLAEKASGRTKSSKSLNLVTKANTGADAQTAERFEILANVLWAEIGSSVAEELGSVIFSVGRPDEFHHNYTITQNFVSSIEHFAPSIHAVQSMRNHPVYAAFHRRWQLPVYFQLRWKEIVGKLEDNLSGVGIAAIAEGFSSSQASVVFEAFESCWKSDIYIPELAHRFWRLSLQILSRYQTFLNATLPARSAPTKSAPSDKPSPSVPPSATNPRIATPTPSEMTPETAAADQLALKRFSSAFIDIKCLEKHVMRLWREDIKNILPEGFQSDETQSLEETLLDAISPLTSVLPEVTSQIVIILVRRCSETLALVRSIPSQYRAMTKKRSPNAPSYFVATILQPVRQFFENEETGQRLKETYGVEWSSEVFNEVAKKYAAYLDAMKKTEDSLRRYKKGRVSTFSLFGSSNSKENEEGKDDEWLRAQMILDVQAFGRGAQLIGVQIEQSEAYVALLSLANQTTD